MKYIQSVEVSVDIVETVDLSVDAVETVDNPVLLLLTSLTVEESLLSRLRAQLQQQPSSSLAKRT